MTPSPPPNQKGRGCLKGCLVSTVVLLLLTLASAAAAFYLAGPYVTRGLETARTQYPWVGSAWKLIFSSPGDAGVIGESGRKPGSEDPSLLPEDIVVYPNAAAEAYSIADSEVTVYQQVQATPEVVERFFRRGFQARGWTNAASPNPNIPGRSVWRKPPWTCVVTVIDLRQPTETSIRCNRY